MLECREEDSAEDQRRAPERSQQSLEPKICKVGVPHKGSFQQPEGWIAKKAERQRTDAFKPWCRRLESPLDCKEIKPVTPKGDQPRIVIGRTDAEALILWPSDAKSQLI